MENTKWEVLCRPGTLPLAVRLLSGKSVSDCSCLPLVVELLSGKRCRYETWQIWQCEKALMTELVDVVDSKSTVVKRIGSSPIKSMRNRVMVNLLSSCLKDVGSSPSFASVRYIAYRKW